MKNSEKQKCDTLRTGQNIKEKWKQNFKIKIKCGITLLIGNKKYGRTAN